MTMTRAIFDGKVYPAEQIVSDDLEYKEGVTDCIDAYNSTASASHCCCPCHPQHDTDYDRGLYTVKEGGEERPGGGT